VNDFYPSIGAIALSAVLQAKGLVSLPSGETESDMSGLYRLTIPSERRQARHHRKSLGMTGKEYRKAMKKARRANS